MAIVSGAVYRWVSDIFVGGKWLARRISMVQLMKKPSG